MQTFWILKYLKIFKFIEENSLMGFRKSAEKMLIISITCEMSKLFKRILDNSYVFSVRKLSRLDRKIIFL